MNKRLKLFLIIVLFLSFETYSEIRSLVIQHIDGAETVYEIKNCPVIKFIENELSIQLDNELTITYPTKEIQKFYWIKSSSGIDNVYENTPDISINYTGDNNITVTTSKDCSASIYDMGGHIITSTNISAGNPTNITTQSLHKGIYIISVNGKSLKFVRK